MATTENFYTGNASTTSFGYSFPILQNSDLKVELDGVLKTENTSGTNNDYSISGTNVVFNSAPGSSVDIHIYRLTDVDSPKAVFAAGSSIRAGDLNNNVDQSLYADQEQQQKIKTSDLRDGIITVTKIGPDAVDGTKIADDSINSEHYVDDSIDTQHIAASQITTNELASNAVTTIKITDGNVTRAKLEADIIDSTKLADDSINSEHYVDGSIDHVHLANDIIDGDNIQDDVVNSEHIAAGALDNEHYAAGSITSDKLNDATVITASEQGSATTNDTSFLTSAAADARFFNISSGDTIKDGQTFPDNDTTIATTAAINDRIIDIVNDVGGFDIIESEQHFPNTNPQGQAGSAAVLSIKAATGNLAPSGTTLTITNGNLANNADITITGVTSTIPTGFGFIVESTNTLHTYTFHRLVPNATEVTTVAGNSANVTKVANIDSNVTAVANIDSNVTAVAGNATNINAVAGNATNINAVAADASDIGIVAADGTDIGLVAGSISNVNNVGGSIANVNTVASNLTNVDNFANRYRIDSSDPSTNNDEGDLYFNTTSNELRVYNGSAWQGGVTATGNLAGLGTNTFTGNQTIQNTQPTIFLTDTNNNDDYSIQNQNGYFAVKDESDGQNRFVIHPDGTNVIGGNLDVGSGLDVTGNITVTGNVDGRDVAADGSSLDNIEAGNIGTDVTNGNVKLTPNGTGVVEIRGAGGNDGTLQLNCSAQSHGIKLKSPPHSAGQSYTLTFPSSIVNNGALKTDSSGNLSFGLITNANIADDQIDSEHYVDGSIDTAHLADDAVDGTKLANTSVSAGSYGSSSAIPSITVDAQGRITAASTSSIDSTSISNGTSSVSVANNGNITANRSGTNRLVVDGGGIVVTGVIGATDRIDATNTLNVTGGEGTSAALYLIADQGDDNGDGWRLNSNQDDNDLTFANNVSGSYVDKLTLKNNGNLDVTGGIDVTGNITVTGTVDGVDIASLNSTVSGITTNATHTGEVTGATALTIADDVVDEANLKVSNSPTNGYFLSAQSGNTGGLTWAEVDLTSLSASNLTSGTIPDARFPATLPAISGANLTGVASTTAGGAIYENSQTISADRTIPVGSNGMSAGPITINNNITLTISNGSTYTIV